MKLKIQTADEYIGWERDESVFSSVNIQSNPSQKMSLVKLWPLKICRFLEYIFE